MKRIIEVCALVVCAALSTSRCIAKEKDVTVNADVEKILAEPASKQSVHAHFSSSCFNECWKYIDKQNRTPQDVETMILLANSSLWHWTQRNDCKPDNLAIAYWQLGRVYCLAGDLATAKAYGEKCVNISKEHTLGPFYLGYGYEVLADAAAQDGDQALAREQLALAQAQLPAIEDDFDRDLLKKDLARIEALVAGIK